MKHITIDGKPVDINTMEKLFPMSNKPIPLDDRVLIIPDPAEQVTSGGIIIPDSAKQYDQKKKGTVIVCGKGHVAENTGVFTPITLKEGDRVSFPAFAGQEIKGADIGMEGDYLLLREMDIDFIIGTESLSTEEIAKRINKETT